MSGIVGIFQQNTATLSIDKGILQKMRDTMIHRGPDDEGLYISPRQEIGLGHRRLSIIDLSHTAVQPMSNEDDSLWIVFDGEIYNHAELRSQLESRGRKFKTDHSDTEAILQGYAEWGEEVLLKLRGIFAFAIWDKKKGKLWLARDRIGVKPLYYTFSSGFFLFSSEIKALLEFPGVKREVHEKAFYDALTLLVSPAPQTLFSGIFKLPASNTLTVFRDKTKSIKRYWNPFNGLDEIPQRSEEDWKKDLIYNLRESIRYRMVSDVNIGVFLSGGIDSSANVAIMSELMKRPVETFSSGLKDTPKFDDFHYARMIAEKFKTNHHEIILTPEALVEFLPKLVFHQDEPIVDPVGVSVYFSSKLAKDNGATVCQVGEGADELFCGDPYWGLMLNTLPWVRAYSFLPKAIRRTLWRGLNWVLKPSRKKMRQLDWLRRASFDETFFWGGAEAFQETFKRRILKSSFLSRLGGYSSYEPIRQLQMEFFDDAPEGADYLHWMTYLDLRLRLPELLLMQMDKMTMAASLESRAPFLDQEFVSLTMGVPQSLKYKNRTLKYLLKKMVEPILPHEIICRLKQGSRVPIQDWYRDMLLKWSDNKILDFAKRTDYFDLQGLQNFLNGAQSRMSWFLLNIVLWHEMWIEGKELDLPRELHF